MIYALKKLIAKHPNMAVYLLGMELICIGVSISNLCGAPEFLVFNGVGIIVLSLLMRGADCDG